MYGAKSLTGSLRFHVDDAHSFIFQNVGGGLLGMNPNSPLKIGTIKNLTLLSTQLINKLLSLISTTSIK